MATTIFGDESTSPKKTIFGDETSPQRQDEDSEGMFWDGTAWMVLQIQTMGIP